MSQAIKRLPLIIENGEELIDSLNQVELRTKQTPDKWSPQEIMGHLVDSAIQNLLRFLELSGTQDVYTVEKYNQEHLVQANAYNDTSIHEVMTLWRSLNQRIFYVVSNFSNTLIEKTVILPEGKEVNVDFLIHDYLGHIEHHFKQIENISSPN